MKTGQCISVPLVRKSSSLRTLWQTIVHSIIEDKLTDKFHLADPLLMSCAFCGKEFKSKRTLENHMRDIHSDSDEKFICELCLREFKNINTLRNHKSLYHR